MFCISDTDETAEVPSQQQVKDNTVSQLTEKTTLKLDGVIVNMQ